MNIEEKISKILEYYGGRHQLVKCSEECSELLVELNKAILSINDKKTMENKIQLVGELADAYVMIMQVAEFVGIKSFWEKVDYKLDRQLERIKIEDAKRENKDVGNAEVL